MHASLIKSRALWLALLLLTLVLSACASGPRQVSGELPLVRIDSLERHNGEITLVLGLRNVNDRPLPLNEVRMQLRLNEEALLDLTHTPDIEISPRGREVLRVRGPGLPAGQAILDQMNPESAAARALGELSSATWRLDLNLTDERGRERATEASGFLHPVPGQPDRFR